MKLAVVFDNFILVQDKSFVSSVVDQIDARKIRDYLNTLSKEPHLAASDRDRYYTWTDGQRNLI
jgi:hypothetical protein